MKIPTDRQILNEIYKKYYEVFCKFEHSNKNRISKIYVPIDIELIARILQTDNDIVFGRLYYHLERKYAYKSDNGLSISFFEVQIGEERHLINFPLLVSILAVLNEEYSKANASFYFSIAALALSIATLAYNVKKGMDYPDTIRCQIISPISTQASTKQAP